MTTAKTKTKLEKLLHSFIFFALLFLSVFFFGCNSTQTTETTAGIQAREQAAHIDLFVEQKVKPAEIQTQTKTEIITEFENCSNGLRNCAKNLEQVSSSLDQAQKQILKHKATKARLVSTIIVLSVLILGFVVVRVLVFVYLKR